MPERLLVASNNAGKLREFGSLLGALGIIVVPQGELAIPEAAEPYPSFVENALAKARHAAQLSGLAALADDSGLCVDALDGAPGVQSARYAGEPRDDARNNAQLLAALAQRGATAPRARTARFVCTLVLVRRSDDPDPLVAQGRWHGRIALQPAGSGGFGYDPLFELPELGCTSAELPAGRKNQLSHRAQALPRLLVQLRAEQS
ncbi:MAG: RdgB/HAM1 family non-canonical purine NTP pyrophosphatase [Pseudomonadota bacterium]|nr:RdgB/HAM1 family non-canonical purine NTP pyrophosphatase [Pseudomonadota bacterium]